MLSFLLNVVCLLCLCSVAVGQEGVQPTQLDEGLSAELSRATVLGGLEPGQSLCIPQTSPLYEAACALATLTTTSGNKQPVFAPGAPGEVAAFTTFSVTSHEPDESTNEPAPVVAPLVTKRPDGAVDIDPRGGTVVFALPGGPLFQVAATTTISTSGRSKEATPRPVPVIRFDKPDSPETVQYVLSQEGAATATIAVKVDSSRLPGEETMLSQLKLGFRTGPGESVGVTAPLIALVAGGDGTTRTALFHFEKLTGVADLGREAVLLDGKGNVVALKTVKALEPYPAEILPTSGAAADAEIARCNELLKRIDRLSAKGEVLVRLHANQAAVGSALVCLRPHSESRLRQLEAQAESLTKESADQVVPAKSESLEDTDAAARNWLGASRFFLNLTPVAYGHIEGDSRLESDDILLHGLGVGYQISNDWDLLLAGYFGEIETEGEPTEDRFIKGLIIEGEKKKHTLTIVDLLLRYSIISGANARLLLCAGPTWWSADGEDAVGVSAGLSLQWRFGPDSRVVLGLSLTYSDVNLKSDDMDISGGTVAALCLSIGD